MGLKFEPADFNLDAIAEILGTYRISGEMDSELRDRLFLRMGPTLPGGYTFESVLPAAIENIKISGYIIIGDDTDQYPHTCDCGSPAWRGLNIECSNPSCVHHREAG